MVAGMIRVPQYDSSHERLSNVSTTPTLLNPEISPHSDLSLFFHPSSLQTLREQVDNICWPHPIGSVPVTWTDMTTYLTFIQQIGHGRGDLRVYTCNCEKRMIVGPSKISDNRGGFNLLYDSENETWRTHVSFLKWNLVKQVLRAAERI